MRRVLSLLLSVLMTAVLGLNALAAEEDPAEDREAALTRVAAIVKETLEVDDDYTRFRGDYNDGLRPGWYLDWSDDGRDLSVTCDEEGVVTEVYRWNFTGQNTNFYGFDAAFPAVTEAEAETEAAQWLDRLLAEGETARIDRREAELTRSGSRVFQGRILMDGLESPVTFSLRIGPEGLAGYSRSDSYKGYVGERPDPAAETDEAEAAALLREAVAMDLYYVSADGEARLRYVPVGPHTVVDAKTGEAVDMDALYVTAGGTPYGEDMAQESAAADMAAGRGLTEVELASIARYKDVLTREALDEELRAVPQLGLEDFQLTRCSYAMGEDEESLSASLTYTAEMGPDRLFGFSREAYEDYTSWGDRAVVYKYVTVDARTGAVRSVSTSYPLWNAMTGGREEMGDEIAEAFLTACAPDLFGETLQDRGESDGAQSTLTYTRLHDGYRFPENFLQVTLNLAMDTVDEFRYVWDEGVTFAPSEEIVTAEEAADAYADARTVTLGYAAWPEALDYDDPVLYQYLNWGYTWVESLRLAYYYSDLDGVSGVDALTGELIRSGTGGGLAYSDIDDAPQGDAIRALGAAGIGFDGGRFRPAEDLTLRDAVALLLRAEGNDPAGWDDRTLREEAVWQGFIAPSDWEPERVLTRMDFLRMVLGASRYGDAAALEGVWAGEYPGVAAADTGFAAIAAALGMTAADDTALDETCTRAGAAELLYGFMSRESA